MKFKLYTNSRDAWHGMYELMSQAKKSIFIEMFIFSSDTENEYDFVSLLAKKAQEGVRVVLILDSFGSRNLDEAVISRIKNAGGEILFFRKGLFGTHRKVVILDGVHVFLGGVNIKRASRDWHDLMVLVTEPRIAYLASRMFFRTYASLGGANVLIQKRVVAKKFKKIQSFLLEHAPLSNLLTLGREYKKMFFRAQSNLCIVTPYFVPAPWMFGCVRELVAKGVTVDFVFPEKTDNFFLDRVNFFYAKKMQDKGASVYWFSEMNHAKIVLIDDIIVSIGSGNINNNSFHFSNEAHIVSRDALLISQTRGVVSGWMHHSRQALSSEFVLKWYDYILAPIIRLFSFVL